MAREIPEPVRAAVGLAATVLDEARKLPETIPGLPLRAIGLAMQASLKLQQQYAGLVARGDELFTGLLGDAEPGLATFDDEIDDVPAPPATTPPGFRDSAFDRAEAAPHEDPLADADFTGDELADELVPDVEPTAVEPADVQPTAVEPTDVARDAIEELAIEELVDAAATAEPAAEESTSGNGGEPSGSSAPSVAPVDGYDSFSIAQLRGRLRGYAASTVEGLVTYERATRAREPYLRMLRNRLERLDAQAVQNSPLAPRGA